MQQLIAQLMAQQAFVPTPTRSDSELIRWAFDHAMRAAAATRRASVVLRFLDDRCERVVFDLLTRARKEKKKRKGKKGRRPGVAGCSQRFFVPGAGSKNRRKKGVRS